MSWPGEGVDPVEDRAFVVAPLDREALLSPLGVLGQRAVGEAAAPEGAALLLDQVHDPAGVSGAPSTTIPTLTVVAVK